MQHAIVFGSLLLAALHTARAEVVDIHWPADGRFTHKGSIAAGKFVEICGKLPAGVKVNWRFEAGAPVDFNVHYHIGKDVAYPFKQSAVLSGKDTLDAKIEQDYCWMWSNKSAAPSTLAVQMQRQP